MRTGMAARIQLQILLGATAKAFGRPGRCIIAARDPRMAYARFTKECMEARVDRRCLFRVCYRLGRALRKILWIRDPERARRLVFYLYRNLGITMDGELPGIIVVSECFFGRIYSAEECRYISAMDAGIIAGICGSGQLCFTERITEGCDHCTACFTGLEDPKKTAVVRTVGAGSAQEGSEDL